MTDILLGCGMVVTTDGRALRKRRLEEASDDGVGGGVAWTFINIDYTVL